MPKLIKNVATTYIPGDPGSPGSPATSEYWVTEEVTTCSPAGSPIGTVAIYQSDSGSVGFGRPTSGYTTVVGFNQGIVCTTKSVSTLVPAQAAIPPVPYAPPTSAQISISLNEGWNSYASTIDLLDAGKYINFTIKSGTKGALLAVAYPGFEGEPIAAFTHGLMIDVSGVRVFESGVVVATLGVNQPGTEMRIARLSDGRIIYAMDTGAFYISTMSIYPVSLPLFVYGMLYAGNDEVSSAKFIAADLLSEPALTFKGVGSLVVQPTQDVQAAMAGTGSILGVSSTVAIMLGTGALSTLINIAYMTGVGTLYGLPALEHSVETTAFGTSSMVGFADVGGRGLANLPYLAAVGTDYAYGIGLGNIPHIVSGMTNGEQAYTPSQITMGYANLPFIIGFGHGIDIDHGNGNAELLAMIGLGGNYLYGFGYGELPRMYSMAYGGFVPDDTLLLISPIIATAAMIQQIDIVLVFTSNGHLESAQTLTRALVLEMLSAAQATGELGIIGVYGYSFLSGVYGLSTQTFSVGGLPDLNDSGMVWVINRDTGASSQYEQYGFNSFFERAGEYYGVTNDGVYLLGGDTDAGAPISALIETGRTDLGYTGEKRVRYVYLGVGSDGELYLKVDAEEQQYVYAMRSHGTAVKSRTVEIGWGVTGDYWDFTLINPDGVDFNLASIAFTPIPLARRG